MKEKEKKLLLKDLCARLPYGVKVQVEYDSEEFGKTTEIDEITMIDKYGEEILLYHSGEYFIVEDFKVYLRPISSMTDEEREQYRKFSYYGAAGYRSNDYKEMVATPSFEKMDFLNAHHFDYRGLIEKGLALEASEGMYNLKEK